MKKRIALGASILSFLFVSSLATANDQMSETSKDSRYSVSSSGETGKDMKGDTSQTRTDTNRDQAQSGSDVSQGGSLSRSESVGQSGIMGSQPGSESSQPQSSETLEQKRITKKSKSCKDHRGMVFRKGEKGYSECMSAMKMDKEQSSSDAS